ncbi:DnaJ-like protein, partial [Oleoguttula sp. CCFEE 5521]
AQRDPDEEGDYMAFEQLMAEATAKKEKKKDKHEPKQHDHKHAKAEKVPDGAPPPYEKAPLPK